MVLRDLVEVRLRMRTDEETRSELARVLMEDCPLKNILKNEKPCPYFGHDMTCTSCTYHWQMSVGRLLKEVDVKRISYVRIKEQLDKALERISEMEKEKVQWIELIGDVVKGVRSLGLLRRLATDTIIEVVRGKRDISCVDKKEKENVKDGKGKMPEVRNVN